MPAPLENRPSVFSSPFDVVVLATSLGGLRALSHILSALPVRFPVPIIVVQHLSARHPSHLDKLLGQYTALSVEWAENREHLRPGHVYLAPPNQHLLVSAHQILRLSQSPPVNFSRPAADPLLQSVATHYQQRALAVILTGAGSDGAQGILAIKRNGGHVLAQDRATSEKFDMPEAAIRTGCVDSILPLSSIAPALLALVMVPQAAALSALDKAASSR